MGGRKRKRRSGGDVPIVLRKAYGDSARVLGDAIVDMASAAASAAGWSAESCSCGGGGCLACRGAAHLVRDGDPGDFRRLVARAVCVVQEDAPPPPRVFSLSVQSQYEVVQNTLKLMFGNESPTNMLFYNNDEIYS